MQNGITLAGNLSDYAEKASDIIIPSLVSEKERDAIARNYAGFHCYLQGFLRSPPADALQYKMEDRCKKSEPLRVMLWAPPRSLSTAFERCMASSGDDVKIYHEMYTAAYHLGPERQAAIPVATKMVTDKRFTYEWVQTELEKRHSRRTRVVFCKELAYTMNGHFSSLPSGYKHTFLIRHPAKVFMSMSKLMDKFVSKRVLKLNLTDVLPEGLVFRELYELFCHITNRLDQTPIIIDADDLIEQPEGTLRAYCRAVGLQYSPAMLQWNPLTEERDRWNYSTRLMFVNRVIGQYDRAFSTSKLEKGDVKPLDFTAVTEAVLHATEASVQYYEKLYRLRLRPLGADSDEKITNSFAKLTEDPNNQVSRPSHSLGIPPPLEHPGPSDVQDSISRNTQSRKSSSSEGYGSTDEDLENYLSRRAVLRKLAGEIE